MSLKAELLRKQQDVSKLKKQDTSDPFMAVISKRLPSNKKRNQSTKQEAPSVIPTEAQTNKSSEDHELLAKSKRILEAKAKLYDRMTASGGSLNTDDTCLVRFNQKKQDQREYVKSSSESSSDDDEKDEDDDKWTEYTDCLGRTRKCLKEDVDVFKKKDMELAEVAKSRMEQIPNSEQSTRNTDDGNANCWFVDTKGISSSDLPIYKSAASTDDDTLSMISKSTKMEEMRQQWERKEQENMDLEKIHYQDVLFNEARSHGIGYYQFSTDQSERLKQQNELTTEREKTLEAQEKREKLRLQRENIIAERVFAAKNRQRARLGLPPLEKDDPSTEKHEETKEERKQQKREEKDRKKKEKLERKREELRAKHVRAWDKGKDGAAKRNDSEESEEWEYKPDKPEPMSQEQWNEHQRNQRNPDFAPPVLEDEQPSNRFTTIKTPKTFKRRNIIEEPIPNMYSEPIRNELDGNDFPVDVPEDDDRNKRRRAEFAPPPTFEYYGPSDTKAKRQPPTASGDITASIEAGLRFLREQSDKNTVATKQGWVAKADYGKS